MPDLSPDLRRLQVLTAELVGPELFSRLIESLPDALVVVNDQGVVVLFNGQAELLSAVGVMLLCLASTR